MLILPFAGKVKRRPLWLGLATAVSAVGVLISAIPHFTGRRQIATDRVRSDQLCGDVGHVDKDNCEESSSFKDLGSIAVIFFGQVLFGLVNALFWIFGMTYADDNTTRANSPFQVALSMAGRVAGPTLGYFLGAVCLNVYSDPWRDPVYDESDPRWIGAWWVGFVVVGVLLLILGPFLTLFPAALPLEKSDGMSQKRRKTASEGEEPESAADWAREFLAVTRRLMSNKPYVFNVLSTVAFAFAISGVTTFMPKYLEFQFHQKASTSGGLGGLSKTLSAFVGIVAAGVVMSKIKVRARSAAAYCASGVFLSAMAFLAASQLSCEGLTIKDDKCIAAAATDCNCGDVVFAPICAADGETAFASPCHAGCTSSKKSAADGFAGNRTFYFGCGCVAEGAANFRPWWEEDADGSPPLMASAHSADIANAVEGYCPADCSSVLYVVLGLLGLASLITSSSRVPNFICFLRSVEVRDKAASMSLVMGLLSLFALLPGPIIYGALIDSSCRVWGERCGKRRNCLVYDTEKLRHNFCGLTAAVLLVGFVFDLGVWYYIRDVEMYDDDEDERDDGRNGIEGEGEIEIDHCKLDVANK